MNELKENLIKRLEVLEQSKKDYEAKFIETGLERFRNAANNCNSCASEVSRTLKFYVK